jgi:hypothetical protein
VLGAVMVEAVHKVERVMQRNGDARFDLYVQYESKWAIIDAGRWLPTSSW